MRVGLLLIVCALLCVLPGRALASSTEETILLDDGQLVYSPPKHVARVLEQLKALGVDRVKVSVVWALIAPKPKSSRRPNFDATDPNAYPAGGWARYDLLDRLAATLGIGLYFQLDPFSPKWATAGDAKGQGSKLGRYPDPPEFEKFVEAVGRRYDGSDSSLPRVNYWGVWNEPNESPWLNPWHRGTGSHRVLLEPPHYRRLLDAAWSGLMASGHQGDTILIGETANVGVSTPLQFIRALYCVDSAYTPLQGAAAAAVGCPTAGNPAAFVAAHPGLFEATGFAHHPYAFNTAPNRPYPDPTWVTLQNIQILERVLKRIFAVYGLHPTGGVPLYLTEWGYKTNPPNPFVHTSLAQQATWLNQGEYMTWLLPYVRSIAQFELVDSRPKPHEPRGSRAYWATFQTGLEFANGSPKPSYSAFRLPIWLPSPNNGPSVTVWGQLRPANHSATQVGTLWFRPSGGAWTAIAEVQTTSPYGFFLTHAAIPAAGEVKLGWQSPAGATYYSRLVTIK